MKIEIKSVNEVRYPTIGDFYKKDEKDIIEVLDTNKEIYNRIVAIHELIEQTCTEYMGISEEEITKFDLDNLDSDEPGELPNSPYKEYHLLAEIVERMICNSLNIDFNEYNEHLAKVFDNANNSSESRSK